jgi:hypothetical protein
MNILVFGAGAAGLPVADVYAVCRASHADAIRDTGSRPTGLWGDHPVRFPCGEDPPDRDGDHMFMTAPSIDTREDPADRSREP